MAGSHRRRLGIFSHHWPNPRRVDYAEHIVALDLLCKHPCWHSRHAGLDFLDAMAARLVQEGLHRLRWRCITRRWHSSRAARLYLGRHPVRMALTTGYWTFLRCAGRLDRLCLLRGKARATWRAADY